MQWKYATKPEDGMRNQDIVRENDLCWAEQTLSPYSWAVLTNPQKSHKLVWEKLFLLAEFWFCVFSLRKVKPTQWPTQLPVFGISLSLVISPGEWVNVPVSVTYRVLLSIILEGRDLISISLIMLFKHVTWIFFHLSYVSSFVKTQISLFFLLFSPFPLLRLHWARQQNAKTWNWKDCLWSYKKGIL